ncbi:unnamed protein product, partial [Mesorhabditis belari]|uniref:Anoctamin n=1 Tax=Mesorhabditis belari TaxID=2138241 RepID=A0AAF3FFN1_9BILA
MLQQKVQNLVQEGIQQGHRLALSSDLWRYASESGSSCDVLLALCHDDDDQTMKDTVCWLVNTLRHLEPALIVEVRHHRLNDCYALYFSADYRDLLKGAELCHLKKPVKPKFGGGLRDFCFDEAHCFNGVENKVTFLTGTERAWIVKQMIEGIRIPRGGLCLSTKTRRITLPEMAPLITHLSAVGIVDRILPLHDANQLRFLQRKWVMSFLDPQPLDLVKDYFGTEIAMYFSWLGFLTSTLWFPAGLGLIMFLFGGFTYKTTKDIEQELDTYQLLNDICFVLFAFVNCIWSTVYLELWKRKQAELAFKWGTYTVEINALLHDPRPGFKGEFMAPNPVTGLMEPQYPAWKCAAIRYGLTYPITFFCVFLMFCAMLLIFTAQDTANYYFGGSLLFGWICYVPMIIYALLIVASEKLYRLLALFLNNLENYRTADEYEDFLVSKIVIFQFVTAFGSLFYIAFIIKDMKRLQETLATLLITRQLTQNIMEMAVPFLIEKFKFSRLTYKMTRSMSDDTLRRHVQEIRRKRNESESEASRSDPPSPPQLSTDQSPSTIIRQRLLKERSPSDEDESVTEKLNNNSSMKETLKTMRSPRLPLPEFVPHAEGVQVTQAELESLMSVYERPLDDYLEMFIQFGYVLLFSPAFPLAAVCALVNNLIEIRVDAFKLCNTVQRPFGRRVRDIGAWQYSMQLLGTLGVMVNCALIGQSGLVQRIWPELSWASQIVIVVVLEHVMLGVRALVDSAVPDVPQWIKVETAKQEHFRAEAFKRSSRLLDRFERAEFSHSPPSDPLIENIVEVKKVKVEVQSTSQKQQNKQQNGAAKSTPAANPSVESKLSESSSQKPSPKASSQSPQSSASSSKFFKRRSITPMMRFSNFMKREQQKEKQDFLFKN